MSKLTEDEVVQIAKDCGVLPADTPTGSKTIIFNLSKELLTFANAIEAKVRAERASLALPTYKELEAENAELIEHANMLRKHYKELLTQSKKHVEDIRAFRKALLDISTSTDTEGISNALVFATELVNDSLRSNFYAHLVAVNALETPLPSAANRGVSSA